jgi:hypothetical protein
MNFSSRSDIFLRCFADSLWWLYADPATDASVDFQHRLAQMATLEADTKRAEKQTAVLAKAKKKQQPSATAPASSAGGLTVSANLAVITGTKGKEKDPKDSGS